MLRAAFRTNAQQLYVHCAVAAHVNISNITKAVVQPQRTAQRATVAAPSVMPLQKLMM
jgi:hypothetical protein